MDPSATPQDPTVLAHGQRSDQDTRLQHNNVRMSTWSIVNFDKGEQPVQLEVRPTRGPSG